MVMLGVGILIGFVLGAIWMLLFIKETKADVVIERQIEDLDDPWNTDDDLPEPKEVKYGDF